MDVFILDGVGHQVTQEDPQRIAEMVFDDVIAQEAARMMQDEVREASAE